MNTDKRGLENAELTEKIIRVFFDVYNELGCGLLEWLSWRLGVLALAWTVTGLRVEGAMVSRELNWGIPSGSSSVTLVAKKFKLRSNLLSCCPLTPSPLPMGEGGRRPGEGSVADRTALLRSEVARYF